ncbi:glycoside hydrolase family 2 TIM barrel-domain containing protein [Celeribacter sp.]|uniref:glycoside hydrolase family 2 protein n=1 Tax=Celeribacter sp. TaxID=1890673 RepID=UPI003A8CD4D9
MRETISFNEGWLFDGATEVRLPHTAVELPYHYFDETSYQKAFTYEKRFTPAPDWNGKEVVVHFEAAMADARVFLNGEEIAAHKDGYTPFEARLTGRLIEGENLLRVTIDGSENPDIPPFGGQIDYLTYAGIYRDVWLRLSAPVTIASVKIETPDPLADEKSVRAAVTLANPQGLSLGGTVTATLRDAQGAALAETQVAVVGETLDVAFDGLTGLSLWDLDTPTLYTLDLRLEGAHGSDHLSTRFGFRAAEFTADGFFLNGRAVDILGLNRHQSFPYMGYALGADAQKRDADILKDELHLNLVRTSHYPQSTHFLDRCDEIGLLVFEEIPGWQHIGGEAWKAESVENVRRMITRDWNHPSIILWGVRINESPDDHDFYVETNQVARALDATRQTGGVRCHEDSEFLEDVYTMNDFFQGMDELPGDNRPPAPLRSQREVTGLDHDVPYMITEYNGHMFPTKAHDQELRQAEHVTRHLNVLNAAFGAKGTAGCIGWCAFDYNTHKDFGAGDRICYHGVMDMFREPKFAAFAYASQGAPEGGVVLEPVTYYARGERNIHGILPLIVLTNAEEVAIQYGDFPPVRFKPDTATYPHLPHAPVIIRPEDMTSDKFGDWGMTWQDAQIIAYIDGEEVARRRFACDPVPTTLQVVADTTTLPVGQEVRVMVRLLDQVGNKLRHSFDPVTLNVSGGGALLGPDTVPLRAGATGAWVRATASGEITLSAHHATLGTTTITLQAE